MFQQSIQKYPQLLNFLLTDGREKGLQNSKHFQKSLIFIENPLYIYIIPGKNSKNDGIQDFRANFRVVFSRGASLVVLYIFLQSGAYT